MEPSQSNIPFHTMKPSGLGRVDSIHQQRPPLMEVVNLQGIGHKLASPNYDVRFTLCRFLRRTCKAWFTPGAHFPQVFL